MSEGVDPLDPHNDEFLRRQVEFWQCAAETERFDKKRDVELRCARAIDARNSYIRRAIDLLAATLLARGCREQDLRGLNLGELRKLVYRRETGVRGGG